ncbi:MAG TPA: lysylphosphatidylglycerol synthase transmembrane domain-containing protein [Chloroflexia bacterium]|nr:lysylphosphatidylglycerol synthase transmembrane domain-containing protein [Chloroflexia bacterium]
MGSSLKKILAGLAVSVACLYLVLRGVHWEEIPAHLGRVNGGLLALAMLGMVGAYAFMAWRWHYLLAPLTSGQPPSYPVLFGTMMTGYFFNTFFPARAGDLMRAHIMSRRTGLRRTTILATVVIEKLFDGLALLVWLVAGLPALPLGSGTTLQFGVIAVVLLAAGFGGLWLVKAQADRLVSLTARVMDLLPVPERLGNLAVRLVHTFSAGLSVFDRPGPLLKSAGISLLVWLVAAGMFWAALAAFNLTPATPAALLLMTALVNLGLLIPAMPGNVGNYEALILATLVLISPAGSPIDKEIAVAFALVFHAGQLLATLLVGGLAFWTQRVSMGSLRSDAAEAMAPAPEGAGATLRDHMHHPAREEAAELGIEKL